jgi:hypothetical protein
MFATEYFGTLGGEGMILALFGMLILTLLILVPQLLRAHLRKVEMHHDENLRSLEQGIPVQIGDDSSRLAARMAMLVPMVVMCAAATVTCFQVAYRADNVFSVSIVVWGFGGIVSLAAVTGGVALIGRLAQLKTNTPEEESPKNPLVE